MHHIVHVCFDFWCDHCIGCHERYLEEVADEMRPCYELSIDIGIAGLCVHCYVVPEFKGHRGMTYHCYSCSDDAYVLVIGSLISSSITFFL